MLLKDFIELIRKALKVYGDLAEINGQDGDYDLFDVMSTEMAIVSDLCYKLDAEYKTSQEINRMQLYTLLQTEDIALRNALTCILETYNNHLVYEKEKLTKQQENIKDIKGVVNSIS